MYGPLPEDVTDVSHVYLGHVLDQYPTADVRQALRVLWSACKPGALVCAVAPNHEEADLMDRRSASWDLKLSELLYGTGRWRVDKSVWEASPALLARLLESSGVHDARAVDMSADELSPFPIMNRVAWQCAAVGQIIED